MNLVEPDQEDEPGRSDVERVDEEKAPKIGPGGWRRDKVEVMQEDAQSGQHQPERTQQRNLEYVMSVGLPGLLAPGFVRIQIDARLGVRG